MSICLLLKRADRRAMAVRVISSALVLIGCRAPAVRTDATADGSRTEASSTSVVAGAHPGRDSASPVLRASGTDRLITLTAVDADARLLLLAIAKQAGIELVVSPDVQARVSVEFRNVPAGDAIAAIVSRAGLHVMNPPQSTSWPPVVFYQLPVDINASTPDVIAARFGVSLEMAKWIAAAAREPR
jgi:hypothetical protein